ncbi:LysR family transcriptional regulator [Neobacillus sp. NPDC093127]|uniref:LysR family transcriptional regulator n=1 Tax=Neobacillus sp. NPDC093127 TaxID=3364296 RepID=UPI0037FEED8B
MLKLLQLKYFVTTVQSGSITNASKILFISQPALSKQLALLGEELGCDLFLRKTTGLELTKAGKFLYNRATNLLKEAELLKNEMEQFTEKSSIKFGALPSMGSYLLPSIIRNISDKYKIELTIRDTTEELKQLLKESEIDFAFVQDAANTANIIVEHLFNEPYDAIFPSSASFQDPFTLQKIFEQKIVLHKHPCDIRRYFEDYCKEKGWAFSVSIDLESNDSIIPFVTNGLGISILPRMVSMQIISDDLIIKPLEDEKLQRSVDFLYKPINKKIAKEIVAVCKDYILENY